jgi:hypothetical protein
LIRQRVWAAKDERALVAGAYTGMVLTVLVTFLFSLGGFMAGWAGLVDLNDPQQINSAFFSILKPHGGEQVPVGILAVVCLLAATMNESAVDSFQNAILDTLISLFVSLGWNVPLNAARLAVVFINVPLMIIGVQGYPIINLYLITNVFTTCSVLPLCVGLFDCFDEYVSGASALFACFFSICSVVVTGRFKYGDWYTGIMTYFYLEYRWEVFIVGLVASVFGMVLFYFLEVLYYSISGTTRPRFIPAVAQFEKDDKSGKTEKTEKF